MRNVEESKLSTEVHRCRALHIVTQNGNHQSADSARRLSKIQRSGMSASERTVVTALPRRASVDRASELNMATL